MPEIRVPFLDAAGAHAADLAWDTAADIVSFGVGPYESQKTVREVRVIYFGGLERPDVAMTFEVRDGYPLCSALEVRSRQDERGVSMIDLPPGGRDLDFWRRLAFKTVRQCMIVDSNGSVSFRLIPSTSEEIDRIPTGNKRVSTKMTPERLSTIADIYSSNIQNGLKAVAEAFQVSEATASRYVKQAREAGLIEDRRRNKTS